MTDVRALLAAERQSRRISHPYLTYTKNQLLCNICQLNIKSEALWEGHLRSVNHKKNVQKVQDSNTKSLKRKIEDVDEHTQEDADYEIESRKKTKSRVDGDPATINIRGSAEFALPERRQSHEAPDAADQDIPRTEPEEEISQTSLPQPEHPFAAVPVESVDEDEWAAFEREVAPLADASLVDDSAIYSSAVISAAPVSAAQLAQQAERDKPQSKENEAEEEKEEEGKRLEDEFEVMEEMEERLRRLREKREALRQVTVASIDTGQQDEGGGGTRDATGSSTSQKEAIEKRRAHSNNEEEEDDDDEEVDDWYS